MDATQKKRPRAGGRKKKRRRCNNKYAHLSGPDFDNAAAFSAPVPPAALSSSASASPPSASTAAAAAFALAPTTPFISDVTGADLLSGFALELVLANLTMGEAAALGSTAMATRIAMMVTLLNMKASLVARGVLFPRVAPSRQRLEQLEHGDAKKQDCREQLELGDKKQEEQEKEEHEEHEEQAVEQGGSSSGQGSDASDASDAASPRAASTRDMERWFRAVQRRSARYVNTNHGGGCGVRFEGYLGWMCLMVTWV